VMQHMLPMYNELDNGTGVTKRRVNRLKLQIEGRDDRSNRGNPPLFNVIRNLFIAELATMVEDTKTKLQEAVDRCSEDIGNDLELLGGESVPISDETSFTERASEILETVRAERIAALRKFEAEING